ncbi:MAG: protealysin inhibitor emfourin [Nocardioides sp.]|jgi:hypothetical protein
MSSLGARCTFIPPYLLREVAQRCPTPDAAEGTLRTDGELRAKRDLAPESAAGPEATTSAWIVHSADNDTTLPGRAVRRDGDAESGDLAVDEAAAGAVAALALARDFERDSYDDRGARLSITVHYAQDYDNAFWDGTQLVFGDGDGTVFERFTKPVDVMAHEFAHAVTQYAAGLVYRDQSGALNESLSDVFAACVKQRVLGQSADEADWLIGEGIFVPGIKARGLRDMAAPGTAYDDPALGKDPQVGHMSDYLDTRDDNGGVHLNSGIPNRAFQLAATSIGGASWEGAGRIWWQAWTAGGLRPTADFDAFAALTIESAGAHRDLVAKAWADVGVTGAGSVASGGSGTLGEAGTVAVRRTGGFAGRTVEGAIDLTDGSPEAAEAAVLCRRVQVHQVKGGPPMPDHFVYCFALPERSEFTVPEQHLTPELAELAALVLQSGLER